VLPSARFYRPQGDDRVAVVSIEPSAGSPGAWLLRVARARVAGKPGAGQVYGPFAQAEISSRFDAAVALLIAEGFSRAIGTDLLLALESKNERARALAAVRLGWRRATQAVEPLLALGERAKGERSVVLDALGRIGDARAVGLARAEAAKKLLSRRRSGAEALRNLGDAEGLADVRNRALERLPDSVRGALAALDETKGEQAALAQLVDLVGKIELKRRGLVVDTLYEIGTPATVAAARQCLGALAIEEPHIFRYAKSVLKRATLRHDAKTFALLAHAIEAAGRSHEGTTAHLKSGYDGEERDIRVFGRRTQRYLKRASWRYLRDLAQWRRELYTEAAAEVLVRYSTADEVEPSGAFGAHADCHLLQRIAFGRSSRLELVSRTLRVRFKPKASVTAPAGAREESFSELWDAHPKPYLRLLSRARLLAVQQFALDGVARHPALLAAATRAQLLRMLKSDNERIQRLALDELERRFDPARPDLKLMVALSIHRSPAARLLAARLIEAGAPAWTRDTGQIEVLLGLGDPALRERAESLVLAALPGAQPELRERLAKRLVAVLTGSESEPGAHSAYARVGGQGLWMELERLLTLPELLSLIDAGSASGKTLAATLIVRRRGALEALGLDRVVALAESEIAAVRSAAGAIVSASGRTVEPWVLFALAESAWPDTRALAFERLRGVPLAALGLDGVIRLADSSRSEVQELGRELVLAHFAELDAEAVLFRLVEHPSVGMRLFALSLVEAHLRPGFVPLGRIEGFCRSCLFDLVPSRELKHRLVDFLRQRGLADENQGALVVRLLGTVLRTHTREDFERIARVVVEIQLAHPGLESELLLHGGAAP
jgi:hypothetical protein